ncbi:MAG: sensor histidine kinase [Alicyclobacillus sp.]|nr:sensor histidine kinase [Alicyclobacillus sp.]
MNAGDLPIYDETDQGIKLIEEERRRIARELHDGPAQVITNLSMRLDIVRRMLERQPDLAAEELDRLYQRARGAVSEIRRLIYDLRPIAIDEVGLLQAIGQLCDRNQEDWALPIAYEVAESMELKLVPARQVGVYRLLQEVLNNVHKHAEATRIHVSVAMDGSDYVFRIEDDGRGFDPAKIPAGHYGILGLYERARYLKGTVRIDSAPGQGTQVEIRIPQS